jgi:glycosyltransferase involved in cell wall biosynthesis
MRRGAAIDEADPMDAPRSPDPSSISAMRIVVVTETYPPEVNGVAHTLGRLAEGLIDKGHSLQVIRPRQGREDLPRRHERLEELLLPGLPIPGYRGLRFGLPAVRALAKCWRRFDPDVIYIATEGPLGMSALRAARSLGIATVSGFHTKFDYYSRYYRLGFLEGAILAVLRRFHNGTGCTLVPTTTLREQLETKGFENVRVLSRGVDIRLFQPGRRRTDLRGQWGVAEDGLAVIYVGRLAPEKNLSLAVEAFRGLQARRPEARFVVVGDGPAARELRRLNPDFVFCGMRTGEDLAEHYASGDLFLFPSSSETYGNVVLEAMASSLPVLSFDYAAGREHIVDGHSGALVPLGDHDAFIRRARELVEHTERLRQMGIQARYAAERLDWRRIHDRFERVLYGQAFGGLSYEPVASND